MPSTALRLNLKFITMVLFSFLKNDKLSFAPVLDIFTPSALFAFLLIFHTLTSYDP